MQRITPAAHKARRNEFYRVLGREIRRLREKKGVTMLDFAKSLQMTPQQMGRIEGGLRRLDLWTLDHIAKALGVTAGRLLTRLPKFGWKAS